MFSTTSQHAIRALVELSALAEGKRLPGWQLAEQACIPVNYMSKIMHTMQKGGLVEASRGVGGGYALSRPAHRIMLSDVVEIFEGVISSPPCLLGVRVHCSEEQPCGAHTLWREVRQRTVDFLTTTSIAQIAVTPGGLGEPEG